MQPQKESHDLVLMKQLYNLDYELSTEESVLIKLWEAHFPCIHHWNQNHFVVVYKIKKRKGLYSIYVADPGKGLITYTKEDFGTHWISTQTSSVERELLYFLSQQNNFIS